MSALDQYTSETAQAEVDRARNKERLRRDLEGQAAGLRGRVFVTWAAANTAWWDFAAALYDFYDARAWEPLGYGTLEEFLAEPELGISRRQFFRAVQLHREFVVVRQVPTSALEGVSPSKVEPAMPALTAGEVSPDTVLGDAKALTTEDVREKYRGDPNAPLDGEAEPPQVQCPCCKKWGDPAKFDKSWTPAEGSG